MLKKILSSLGVALLATAGFLPASPAMASGIAFPVNLLTETRPITVGTAFTPEANDQSVSINVAIDIAQAALSGATTDVYRVRGSLKQGTTVVSLESDVNFQDQTFWKGDRGSNIASPKATSATGSSSVDFDLNAAMFQGESYTVEVEVYKNGTALTLGTDFTVQSASGVFYLWGNSVTPTGSETGFRFAGDVCVAASSLSGMAVGDQLAVEVTDASSRTYSFNTSWYNAVGSSYRYSNTSALVADDLVSGIKIYVNASVAASGSGIYAPSVSIKKVGSATELATECLTAPSAAPTLTASPIGISMAVTVASGQDAECFLAHKDNPRVIVASSGSYGFNQTPTCTFTGLKRAEYVGWYFLDGEFYSSQNNRIFARSTNSPVSTSVAYAGGNGTFSSYTGSAGGSGQGSLQISTVSNNFFDYGTAGYSFVGYYGGGQTPGRSSDGQGGLLIASIEGSANQVNIRRLTPSGQDMTFASDGNAEVAIRPFGIYRGAPTISWYGTSKDKWLLQVRSQSMYGYMSQGVPNESVEFVYGTYAGGQQGSTLISPSDVSAFCSTAIQDDNNRRNYGSGGYVRTILSAPTAEPLIVIDCNTQRTVNSRNYYSYLPFLAKLDGQGQLVLRNRLASEPTDAAPCVESTFSGVNAGATGSDVLIASYEVKWLPTTSGCDNYSGTIDTSTVVSRNLYRVLANTATVDVTPDQNVFTNAGTEELIPGYYEGIDLFVSGPNVFLRTTTEVSAGNMMSPPVVKYQIGVLSNGSFGEITTLPTVKVGTDEEFSRYTDFSQIPDFSENDATSILLLRTDEGGSDSGTTAARVSMADGSIVSYRQMVSTLGGDGFSTAVGNASGDLTFYGIKSLTEAVVGTWVTTGTIDPGLAALPVNQGASNTGVSNANQGPNPNPNPNPSPNQNNTAIAVANPFNGPIVNAKKDAVRAGKSVNFSGSNFDGITKVMVGDVELEFEIKDGELVLEIPADLKAGKYDIKVSSSAGDVTVSGAFEVSASALSTARPSTKRLQDGTAKVWVFDAAGAGKVQILLNGKEIAWVRTDDALDPKLTNGYLVRTLKLEKGKNVIQVKVDGVVTRRVAYTF